MNSHLSESSESASEAYRRARMRSRRGLLELDLFLVPFVEAMYDTLSESEQQTYEQLLEEEDTDILDWLKGAPVGDRDMRSLVERIRGWHFQAGPRQ